MSKDTNAYPVEHWNGHDLYVDANGVFFEKEDGRRGTEAKTLADLKRKVAGPHEALDVKAVIFSRWGYREDDNYTIIHVYGVSGVGNVLYDNAQGRKDKAGRHEDVYVFDQSLLDTRQRLRVEKRRVEDELTKLMETWPKVERKAAAERKAEAERKAAAS